MTGSRMRVGVAHSHTTTHTPTAAEDGALAAPTPITLPGSHKWAVEMPTAPSDAVVASHRDTHLGPKRPPLCGGEDHVLNAARLLRLYNCNARHCSHTHAHAHAKEHTGITGMIRART